MIGCNGNLAVARCLKEMRYAVGSESNQGYRPTDWGAGVRLPHLAPIEPGSHPVAYETAQRQPTHPGVGSVR